MFAVFWKDESGATALERGLISVALSLGIAGAAGAVGTAVDELYDAVPEGMSQAVSASADPGEAEGRREKAPKLPAAGRSEDG